MGLAKNSNETVKVLAKNLKMNQNPDMYMFEVTHWDFKHTGNYNQLQVLVVMKRKVLSEIMTTYFPTILLLAITFATTFFKPCFFDAALSVNLTTMLVMTTIFISKMEGLPPTSAIKMIDIWLVICQMVPFAEVVLLTAMEYRREEDDNNSPTSRCVQVSPTDEENLETEESEKERKWYQNFRVNFSCPDLKTVGKI